MHNLLRTAPRHVLLTLVAATLAPAAAHAGLHDAGGFTISAERLFGYAHTKSEIVSGNVTTSGTRSDFALLLASPVSMYSTPRLGLDVSIGNGVTVGGGFGFVVGSTTSGFNFGSVATSSDTDTTTFVLAPRAGYAFALNDKFSLWGRGGFTYFQTSSSGNTKVVVNGMALTIEPTFVYNVATNVGLTFGLTLDLPLTGERKQDLTNNTTITVDNTYRQIGLMVGLAFSLF